jgi:DNA-binding response OmpR family regulator
MQHVPCVLIVDDDPNSLGEIALRILRLGIDVFYAKDRGEAWLLAQQEATRIGVVMFPPSLDFEEVAAVVESLRSKAPEVPRTLVVIGRRPEEDHRKRLRERGVEWALWEPHDESGLRSVVSAAMGPKYEGEPRREPRLPTTLLGRAFIDARRHHAIVALLSTRGAFLETPSPLAQDSLITLEIALPDGSLVVKARVVHARYPSSGEPQRHPGGMGVEFSSLSPEAQKRLRLYLRGIEERFLV